MAADGKGGFGPARKAAGAALLSLLLASCAVTGSSDLEFTADSMGLNPGQLAGTTGASPASSGTGDLGALSMAAETSPPDESAPAPAMTSVMDESDSELPAEVSFVPTRSPAAAGAAASLQAATAPVAAEPSAPPAAVASDDEVAVADVESGSEAAQPAAPASTPTAEKKGFFASLFSQQPREQAASRQQPPRPQPIQGAASAPAAATNAPAQALAAPSFTNAPSPTGQVMTATPQPVAARAAAAQRPLVQLAATGNAPVVAQASLGAGLPGVRRTSLFEIQRKSGMDDDGDIDLHEEGAPVILASAAGLARLAPNGLLKQREDVDVTCLKPSLVRVLKQIEGHYGKRVIVTSGYRSPPHNRKVRGARNSLHMYCAAADIQVPGVTKWELAQLVRNMPGRGGVGTYCHTESVHVDVGPERDWNWRCRRRR